VTGYGYDGHRACVAFDSQVPVRRVELVYAIDTSEWATCKWMTAEACIDAAGERAACALPAGCRAWFFNLTDARGLPLAVLSPACSSPVRVQEQNKCD